MVSELAGGKVINVNKKARFNYHILETYEAGIVLKGPEIKSVREGSISLVESFVFPDNGEIFLIGANIAPYKYADQKAYEPTRRRKLLMHKHEIEKLEMAVRKQGLTIVPLEIYLKNGRAKVRIGLAKGKKFGDKREAIKDREAKRDMQRAFKMSHRPKGKMWK